MKKFRTAFWGGYRKKEVDEYLESLERESERSRMELLAALEENQNAASELKETLSKEKEEKVDLMGQIDILKGKIRTVTDEKEREELKLREKLEEYEGSYSRVSSLLTYAQKEAETVVNNAKANAESLMSSARSQAEEYRKEVEERLEKKKNEDRKQFATAKHNLSEYLNTLNSSQHKLLETYRELGALLKMMPLQMEEVLSCPVDHLELFQDKEEDSGECQ